MSFEQEEKTLPSIRILNMGGVIGFALRSEYQAKKFYAQAADRATSAEARALFLSISQQEHQHYLALTRACRKRFPDGIADAIELGVDGNHDHLQFEPIENIVADIGLLEIVTIAIWEESKARDIYTMALQNADPEDTELCLLLKTLVDEEKIHLQSLAKLRSLLQQQTSQD